MPRESPDAISTPFMSQTARDPPASRHRMSALPSPLKSPVPITDQLVGTIPSVTDCCTDSPLLSQIAILPELSRHRMSALPSPLKSTKPATCQDTGMLPRPPAALTVAPFISHTAMSPVDVLRHRMSPLP